MKRRNGPIQYVRKILTIHVLQYTASPASQRTVATAGRANRYITSVRHSNRHCYQMTPHTGRGIILAVTTSALRQIIPDANGNNFSIVYRAEKQDDIFLAHLSQLTNTVSGMSGYLYTPSLKLYTKTQPLPFTQYSHYVHVCVHWQR